MSKGKKALTIFSLMILLLALAFVVYKLFRVKEVEVIGCKTISDEVIIALSDIEYDQFIFEVDTEAIREAIDTDPYINAISVNIVYPSKIEITIEERIKAAYLKKNDTVLIIDNTCYLLQVLPLTDMEEYPLVEGLQIDECHVGEKLGVRDTFLLEVLSHVLVASEDTGIRMSRIDVSYAADIVVETHDGFTVELGDDIGLDKKFAIIESSLNELQEIGKTGGILDVASGQNAYYREN